MPLFKNEMDREYFHWGATADIMNIIRRRRKSQKHLDGWKEGWKSQDHEQCAESSI